MTNTLAVAPQPPPPVLTEHVQPGPVEQEHIKQALEASQTAIEAIGTLLSLSSWVLTLLGVLIAVLALWGIRAVIVGARQAAKQIANSRFDSYIKSKAFEELISDATQKSVLNLWQNTMVAPVLREETRDPEDPSPFEEVP